MIDCGTDHGLYRIVLITFFIVRVHRTAVDSDANRAVIFFRRFDNELHLLPNGLFFFQMEQVPRIVANLVHQRRNDGCQLIIFLQVHRPHTIGKLLPQSSEGFHILLTVHSNANDIGLSRFQNLYLPGRGFQVLGLGRRHALHSNGSRTTNFNFSYMYFPCFSGFHIFRIYVSAMLRQAQHDNNELLCHSEEQRDEESRVIQNALSWHWA